MQLQQNAYSERLNAVEQYAISTTQCRSRLLLTYFNEPESSNCGSCDYCIKLKRAKLDEHAFEKVIAIISTHFSKDPFLTNQIHQHLPALQLETIEKIIQWLLQEELLSNSKNSYTKPPNINY
jgi:ATP-dependent DNA helicase RecQ